MTARRDFLRWCAAAAVLPPAVVPAAVGPAAARARALAPPRRPAAQTWAALRGEFLLPADVAYFNAATLGAQPRVVLDAVIAHMQHVERDLADWEYKPEKEQFYTGYYPEREVREKIARLINADWTEIALTENATSGMNIIANGLDHAVGDEVVLLDDAHSGSRCGWELKDKRAGVYLKRVKVPQSVESTDQLVELYVKATTPRTRVWVIEHLTSATGILFPAAELCAIARERGILTVVDAAQTVGHLPVDVRAMDCDALYASPSKWLMAPRGTGFLYVRADVLPRVWTTLACDQWDNYGDGAFRLMQKGSANRSLVVGLERAIDFCAEVGHARIHQRILELADRFRTGIAEQRHVRITSPHTAEMRTGMTVFEVAGFSGLELQDALWARGRVRVRRQSSAVRLCCHVWNSEAEVDRAIRTVAALA